MKRYITVMILFICLGCEMIVDIDVPFEHNDLTVNSYFNPDSLWSARVTLNRFILDTLPMEIINTALVVVYEDGNPIDTLTGKGNGYYKSETGKPTIGKTYELRTSFAKYQTASGISDVPVPVEITNSEWSTVEKEYNSLSTFKIKFKDPPGQKNYYNVLIMSRRSDIDFETDEVYQYQFPVRITSDDPTVESVDVNYSGYGGVLMNDLSFEGKEKELTVQSSELGYSYLDEIVVIVRSVSEDYYRYKKTLMLQVNTSGDPLAQPVNVYSNIDGGFGIFAGYSQSTFVHELPKPVITGFSPKQGRAFDHVIITGENFNNSLWVQFGELYAPVVRYNQNEIEVEVPRDVTTGKIRVFINGRYLETDEDFEVIP